MNPEKRFDLTLDVLNDFVGQVHSQGVEIILPFLKQLYVSFEFPCLNLSISCSCSSH